MPPSDKKKNKMIKLETHCHSLGGSHCATSPNEKLIEDYVRAGYGGIVLTNHISEVTYKYQKGETHGEKVRFYFSLADNLREQLKPHGIKLFCGAEIRVLKQDGSLSGDEFTVYGITEKDLFDNKPLFTFSQEELFRFAEKRGLFMYQTHPFRDGVIAGDPRFMHGAEAFNGHFHHYNHNELARAFCEKNHLIGMSGTDYHHERQSITAGIYIPENICTDEQLIEYIFKGDFNTITDAETYEREVKKYKENKWK